MNINELTVEQLEAALVAKKQKEHEMRIQRREAYEGMRAQVVQSIRTKVLAVTEEVHGLFDFVQNETTAFRDIMSEYGQLRFENQQSFTIQDEDFKIEVRSNKVKKFDERADMAAARLIEFLNKWMQKSEKGTEDVMYQLAMTLLERNRNNELDYKSISKLYEYEDKFNAPEYSEIMQLFKESNIVNGTAVNFYFSRKNERGVWVKVEPSFNRL